jgi:23S rRNA pseudouridine1911/1915/1917 synthase
MKKNITIIAQNTSPIRIDIFLSSQSNFTRNEIIDLIANNSVLLNKQIIKKKNTPIKVNDTITIILNTEKKTDVVNDSEIKIPIIFQNENFIVINKPPKIACESNQKPRKYTIIDFAREFWHDDTPEKYRNGMVHRLDEETSGLLLLARNIKTAEAFKALFKERKITKTYLAFTTKGIPRSNGTVKANIIRNPLNPTQMTHSYSEGKKAITDYTVIEKRENFDIVSCTPLTGRTHQIRVHMKALGAPILADKIYGNPSPLISRHALHAHKISFVLNNKQYSFEAPLPEDMKVLIQ